MSSYFSISWLSFKFLLFVSEWQIVFGLGSDQVRLNLMRLVKVFVGCFGLQWEFAWRVLVFFPSWRRWAFVLFGRKLSFIRSLALKLCRIRDILSIFSWRHFWRLSLYFVRTVFLFILSFILKFELRRTVFLFSSPGAIIFCFYLVRPIGIFIIGHQIIRLISTHIQLILLPFVFLRRYRMRLVVEIGGSFLLKTKTRLGTFVLSVCIWEKVPQSHISQTHLPLYWWAECWYSGFWKYLRGEAVRIRIKL